MDNNLIPPFMMREAWIVVNEKAKTHTDDPKDSDHSIMFNSTGFQIPLHLWGTFSYFSTWHPKSEDLLAGHDGYVLSPSKWDPHSEVYRQNKANMTDWEGNAKEPKDRPHQVVIDEIVTEIDASQFVVLSTEAYIIDKVCNGCHPFHHLPSSYQQGLHKSCHLLQYWVGPSSLNPITLAPATVNLLLMMIRRRWSLPDPIIYCELV